MKPNWRRPKVLDSATVSVPTPSGTLHLTFGYSKRGHILVEIIAKIGKAGSYAATQLDILSRLISILLQTSISRKKLIKKIKKSLVDIPTEVPFEHDSEQFCGVEDYLFKRICEELETKELRDEIEKEGEGVVGG